MTPEKPTYRFAGTEPPPALAYLRGEPRWVAWAYEWIDNNWSKIPKKPRGGGNASHSRPTDWGTFDEALDLVRRKNLAGVGVVLIEDDDLSGADLDHCICDSGSYTPLAAEVLSLAETYAEVSPSGEGVRLFIRGKAPQTFKLKHVEVYNKTRYLTVTGWHIDGAPEDLREAPRTLARLAQEKPLPKANGHAAPPLQSGDADRCRDALRVVPSDDYDTWIRVGMALMAGLGDGGFAIWREWSMSSAKFDDGACRTHWRSFKPEGGVTIATVFGIAIEHGWRDELAKPAVKLKIGGRQHQIGARNAKTAQDEEPDAAAEQPVEPLIIHDGVDEDPIPPRGWLLGTTFCKEFMSQVVAAGATGKTALRLAQLIALAIGRPITGEMVHRRIKVLAIIMEDGANEFRRRQRACLIHHSISAAETTGWFYWVTATRRHGKLAMLGPDGNVIPGPLAETIEAAIAQHGMELVHFDPLVKAHPFSENDNKLIDEVMQILADIADRHEIALDFAHHVSKGAHEPGSADSGRGASSAKDAGRLVRTLTTMSREEAQLYDISENQRRRYIRYDDAKVNLVPDADTKWFKLVSVNIGNPTEHYPSGDNIQAVEVWTPPDAWKGISILTANEILDTINAGLPDGERYTDHGNSERAAWRAVVDRLEDKPEAQAKSVIKKWLETGVLERREYDSPTQRKMRRGLAVNHSKRPS